MKQFIKPLAFLFIVIALCGCGKEFLDVKRDANQVVPKEVKDYLAIINRSNMFGTSTDLACIGADEYFVPSRAELIAGSQYTPFQKNAYVWADDVYEREMNIKDWHEGYERIMYANLALDVEKIDPAASEKEDWNRVRVAARFHRAWNYFQLAQVFCSVYDPSTVAEELGLPLRLDYDISVSYTRSSLKQVYDQILKDLHEAVSIPLTGSESIYIPGNIAVKALLARVYLQMGDYDSALKYAEEVLAENKNLVDFNTLSADINSIYSSYFEFFGKNNPSILFFSYNTAGGFLSGPRYHANPEYLSLYEEHDLRFKINFYNESPNRYVYIGSYYGDGVNSPFTGLSVEEVLLIRAECLARSNRIDKAMEDLNFLRRHRYNHQQLELVEAYDRNVALHLIFEERLRELYMRGRRWEDARRLNREGEFLTTFRRELEGELFELKPGSKKWVWPIPQNEVETNNIPQNDRY